MSLATVLGSLYISEIMLIQPCTKCWWIRIGTFPILPISIYIQATKKYDVMNLYIPFNILGIGVSGYYWYLTQFATTRLNCGITSGVNCLDSAVPIIGFVNLPFLGLLVSIAILVFTIVANKLKD